jgi:hypothetical protein
MGPPTIARDRFDYVTAVSESWKRQMLLNLLKVRYADAPVLMDIASVINSYELAGDVSLSGRLAQIGRGARPSVRRRGCHLRHISVVSSYPLASCPLPYEPPGLRSREQARQCKPVHGLLPARGASARAAHDQLPLGVLGESMATCV